MRKHNSRFASRFARTDGDRSNFPQHMAHSIAKNKGFHFAANSLLGKLLKRAGI